MNSKSGPYEITKHPTDIFGLKYKPSVAPAFNDTADITKFWYDQKVRIEFSPLNQDILAGEIRKQDRVLVEIGVCRGRWEHSSTRTLVENKHPNAVYIGIDCEDRSHILPKVQEFGRADILRCDSGEVAMVMSVIKKFGYTKIDVLFIDGDHSVVRVLKEWESYVPHLSEEGVIIFHDTTVHPGPAAIYDAIDESHFDKHKYFADRDDDWGIASVRKKQEED